MKCANGILITAKREEDKMNKEKNYQELQEAIKKVLGMGDALGEITFKEILKEMPQDHSYEVYGYKC